MIVNILIASVLLILAEITPCNNLLDLFKEKIRMDDMMVFGEEALKKYRVR